MAATQEGTCTFTVGQALSNLETIGINFVAFDFDHTILSIHTGGFWEGSSDDLSKHIRPEMSELLSSLGKSDPFHLAVVTFSSQPGMVRSVVERLMPKERLLPIRAEDNSWKASNTIHRGEKWWDDTTGNWEDEAKQPHMLSAIQELETLFSGLQITKSTSLLIDDDPDNIRVAKANGVRVVWLDPDHPENLFSDLSALS